MKRSARLRFLLVPTLAIGAFVAVFAALEVVDSSLNRTGSTSSTTASPTAMPAGAVASMPTAVASAAPAATLARAERRATAPSQWYDSAVFQHSPDWELVVGRHDGRFHGKSIRSFRSGARARLDFYGARMRLYGIVGRGGGTGIVKIDGRIASMADFRANGKLTHRRVFESATLALGRHQLVVEVAASMPNEHARFVNLDGIEIVP
ncbi:MAG: hypothetical protein NVS2B8_06040 [Vulcanimicrobiaceae bacterium]